MNNILIYLYSILLIYAYTMNYVPVSHNISGRNQYIHINFTNSLVLLHCSFQRMIN